MSEIQVNTINEYTSANGVTIDGLLIKDGAIPSIAGGKVLQVVQGTHATQNLIASTSYTDSGLSASITPAATSSKILVLTNHNARLYRGSDTLIGYINIVRESTQITESQIYMGVGATGVSAILAGHTATMMFLDSPSSTSSLTYKTQAKLSTTANASEIKMQIDNFTDTITLIEIGA
jgi:hypothetical protein